MCLISQEFGFLQVNPGITYKTKWGCMYIYTQLSLFYMKTFLLQRMRVYSRMLVVTDNVMADTAKTRSLLQSIEKI